MITRDKLLEYCSGLLSVNSFRDYCPNGLQVEGRAEIRKIVAGVTASQALIDAAVERGADTLLVHHGYFWRGEDPVVQGMKRRRLATLLANDINLIAYHLPLDAHPEYGNNVGLGRALGFTNPEIVDDFADPGLLWQCELAQPLTPSELATRIGTALERDPLHIEGAPESIERVVWCTGGAQQYIEAAVDLRADAYITGEVSEQTTHTARECGIHFFAAGHHATERFGARSLAAHLADKFSLHSEFVDIPNPA